MRCSTLPQEQGHPTPQQLLRPLRRTRLAPPPQLR
jgi:hypothetical protein